MANSSAVQGRGTVKQDAWMWASFFARGVGIRKISVVKFAVFARDTKE